MPPQTDGKIARGRIKTPHLLLLSAALHLVLLLYADHVDSHPERYGGLKYTDVDWRVISDGVRLMFRPRAGKLAQGWLVQTLGLRIGDPYHRATFRYTPLLPLLLAPAKHSDLLGKLVLVPVSLAVPLLLLHRPPSPPSSDPSQRQAGFWATHLLWTLNPFVLNITTRGSPEAFAVFLVVLLLVCLQAADTPHRPTARRWEDRAAVVWSLAVSYKIFPVIYFPAVWTALARRHGWFGLPVWRFGAVTAITLIAVNGALWLVWGQPFLDHTFLYHLTRLDHRHNFSPYFYPIYLSFWPDSPDIPSHPLILLARHPLASFVPQFGIVALAGFLLPSRTSLSFTMFVQTATFVAFNKVCTSQYHLWFLPLLVPVLPQLRISRLKAFALLGSWFAGYAMWLGVAYRLELMAQSVHLLLWSASIAFFVASVWVLGELIEAWDSNARRKTE